MMTFIENAFKYGISNREASAITIRIRVDEQSIRFFCRNRIFQREVQDGRIGTGTENAKKRLTFLYPEKHLLNIEAQNETFTVDLTILT